MRERWPGGSQEESEMSNDLKYGLVLGAVLILIFIGYVAMRSPSQDAEFAGAPQDEPITTQTDMFEPPQLSEPPQRPATVEIEISGGARAPEERITSPTIRGMDEAVVPEPVEYIAIEDDRVAGEATYYTIQKGDVLSKISQRFYGTTTKWKTIHEANMDVIPDPNRLTLGTEIVIPDIAAPPAGPAPAEPRVTTESTGARTHTVGRGETLTSIANAYYGDGTQWRRIYEANKSKIPDPNRIKVGTTLTIP